MSGRSQSGSESMETARPAFSTHEKAQRINRDAERYGTFAEIGAGQEVARWFFQAGGASRTIAKTISAYDMAVSDATYGPTDRYVSRKRLQAMLDHEAALLERQLGRRGEKTSSFVFADTAATHGPAHREAGHGWLGIRFQTEPGAGPSEVIVHAHLPEKTVVGQQEGLGILGVNLIYGAFYCYTTPKLLIGSLRDGLTRERVEVDMIKFSGPAFTGIDQRQMTLQLVEQGLTDAAMFTAEGEVVQPSEVLYKRPILVERGSFRPVTKLTLDMLESAREQFLSEPRLNGEEPVVLMEMTLHNLEAGGAEHRDFLDRAELLHVLGSHVLISNCDLYYKLVEILSRYTDKMIGIALGVPALRALADEQDYVDLAGGRLEAIGRMFKRPVKLYVYPTKEPGSDKIVTVETLTLPSPVEHLRAYLLEGGQIEGLRRYDESVLSIHTLDVLAEIQAGDSRWEARVPPAIVQTIKERELFGYRSKVGRNSS